MNKNGVTLGPQSAFRTKKRWPFKCKAENHQVGGPEAGSCPRKEVTPLKHNPDSVLLPECTGTFICWRDGAREGACMWPDTSGAGGGLRAWTVSSRQNSVRAPHGAMVVQTCSWSGGIWSFQPVLLLITCDTLRDFVLLSGPQFPSLWNGGKYCIYFVGILC